MGPKNSAATYASLPSKELSWIDRMYLKLENMCVEVDKNPSLLLQETSKYMESHMNVVGANVKKLCTELIQDLISPPLLSSEGTEKVPECAMHCKCNCMDLEKPRQKGVDKVIKAGFEDGDKIAGSVNSQLEDISKGGDMIVDAMQGQNSSMEGSTQKSEVSGKGHNVTAGTNNGEELSTAGGQAKLKTSVKAHETATDRKLEYRLSPPKGNPGLNGDNREDSVKAYSKNSIHDESRKVGEEKCGSAEACRGEVDLAEQASRLKENDCEELDAVGGQIAPPINTVAQSSVTARDPRVQLVQVQQHVVDLLHETHASRPKSVSKVCREWDVSHAKLQNSLELKVATYTRMDAKDAKSIRKNPEREEIEQTNEVGGDLQPMSSYVFSQLSNEEGDPMIMSDFLVEDDFEDEEQSAHWFEGEDVEMALGTDIFCTEKLRQAEGFVKEGDSDWELV